MQLLMCLCRVVCVKTHASRRGSYVPFCVAETDLSGSVDGKVQLWLFGQEEPQFEYESPGTSRVTQLHFDMFGNKFGMTDQAGNLNLWRFGSDDQAVKVGIYIYILVSR